MKASEFIKELTKMIEDYGDRDIFIKDIKDIVFDEELGEYDYVEIIKDFITFRVSKDKNFNRVFIIQ